MQFYFFDAKAKAAWLTQKYLDYPDYCQRMKKLIPQIYPESGLVIGD